VISDFRFLISDLHVPQELLRYNVIDCISQRWGTQMDEQQFKDRTKKLAVRIIRLIDSLPKTATGKIIGQQLLRSGTSIGANYRAACRAKSAADMIAKLAIVEEEADESLYWMELLIDTNIVPAVLLADLMKATDEIIAMTVASTKTLRASNRSRKGV
jgi:four helix bundle protein